MRVSGIRRTWFFCCICLFLYGCGVRGVEDGSRYLARELAYQIEPGSRLAVVGVFRVDTKALSELHGTLVANLPTDLKQASEGRFALVERQLIEQALKELNFQMTDLVDQDKAAEVGKFLGADGVISGTAEEVIPGTYRVNLRVIHVETLDILAVARTYLNRYSLLIWSGVLVVVLLVVWLVVRKVNEARIGRQVASERSSRKQSPSGEGPSGVRQSTPAGRVIFAVDSSTFQMVNDAPAYLSGRVWKDDQARLVMAGSVRYQVKGWYNIRLRSETLQAHSFVFSVRALPQKPLGAYSIGIVGDAQIWISHFIRSAINLGKGAGVGENFYSGWGRDHNRKRTQNGAAPPWEAVGRHHDLAVEYLEEEGVLVCLANGIRVHQIAAKLDRFVLEIRFEAVGVEGEFEVAFEDLCYTSLDSGGEENARKFGGVRK